MAHDDPSLLQFLFHRLDEEEEFIIRNTPMAAEPNMAPDFVDRLVGRGALLDRTRLDRDLVLECVDVMRRVQGPPPVPVLADGPDEATVLGSAVLKKVASRFAWHPDYQPHW